MSNLKVISTRYFFCHLLAGSVNSFLDVLLKNGVIVYAAFRADMTASNVGLIATLAWSLFILPFFIFSAHGGYLGDRYDKRKVSLALRAIDIVLAAFAAFGFLSGNIPLLLAVVFAKGTTSTLFSPLKYAMLSEFLPLSALASSSSILEAGTMIAMLGGTYIGAIYGADTDASRIGIIALAATVVSFLATCAGPKSTVGNADLSSPGFNPLKPMLEMLRLAYKDRRCFAAIVALSWYWSLGAVYLSNVTVLVRTILLGDEKWVASILLIFTLGISCGLTAGSFWLHGKPNVRVSNFMTFLIALAGIDLYFSIPDSLFRMQCDFFIIASASGIYAVHFSSVLHLTADREAKTRVFAAYNIASSLLAVLALSLNTWISEHGVMLSLCLSGTAFLTIPITLVANSVIRRHS